MNTKFKQALTGMETWIEQSRQEWKVPGLAIAVVGREGALFSAGFGVREIDGNAPITPDTVFAIGSATKSFTTALLSILTEEGILAWDTPIKEYVPSLTPNKCKKQVIKPFRTVKLKNKPLLFHFLILIWLVPPDRLTPRSQI